MPFHRATAYPRQSRGWLRVGAHLCLPLGWGYGNWSVVIIVTAGLLADKVLDLSAVIGGPLQGRGLQSHASIAGAAVSAKHQEKTRQKTRCSTKNNRYVFRQQNKSMNDGWATLLKLKRIPLTGRPLRWCAAVNDIRECCSTFVFFPF